MEKKLYCVKVVLYVMAENESEARLAATRSQFDIFECTARKAINVNTEWKDAIPYNADDERTCLEIMTTKRKIIISKVRSVKLPAYVETDVMTFDFDNHFIQPGQEN